MTVEKCERSLTHSCSRGCAVVGQDSGKVLHSMGRGQGELRRERLPKERGLGSTAWKHTRDGEGASLPLTPRRLPLSSSTPEGLRSLYSTTSPACSTAGGKSRPRRYREPGRRFT